MSTLMVRGGLAAFIVFHGVMSWPGFAVPWHLLSVRSMPYSTTVLFSSVDVGDAGIRLFGLLWLVTIVAFLLAAGGILVRARWSVPLAASTAVLSLGLSLANVPLAWEGVVINGALLVAIAWLLTRRDPRQRLS